VQEFHDRHLAVLVEVDEPTVIEHVGADVQTRSGLLEANGGRIDLEVVLPLSGDLMSASSACLHAP
jgi:hypothetical protein